MFQAKSSSLPGFKKSNSRSRWAAIGIGLFLSFGLIFLGFNVFQGVITRADDEAPRDVIISKITDTTATVSWTTGVAVTGGVVQYGTSASSLTSFAPADTEKNTEHTITLNLLSPATTYYFVITYGENKKYDNGGAPWIFSTKVEGSSEVDESTDTVESGSGLPSSTPGVEPASRCEETDCDAIKEKLGKGCETRDYILCIRKKAQ